MAMSERSTLILVALIGVAGTIAAALITNPSIFTSGRHDEPGVTEPAAGAPFIPPNPNESAMPATAPVSAASQTMKAPHAPDIQLNQSTQVWGENTKLLNIAAGRETSIDGRDIFAQVSTFPQGNCIGPEYIAFTWQVRDPYPEGGDLEIKQVLQGGSTQRVALGAMGSGQMLPCDIRVFKNNGIEPIAVELRYASAIDEPPPASAN